MEIEKKDLGFTSVIFTHFPLPRTNVGKTWERQSNGIRCIYTCPYGIPHTALNRRWIEILTTQARRSGNTYVDMGSVMTCLQTYGMDSGQYIKPAVNSLQSFGGLSLHTERNLEIEIRGKVFQQYQNLNMTVADKVQITWGKGKLQKHKDDLDGLTFFQFSELFMANFVANAIPHIQADYLKIRSPLEQDLYVWLNAKLFSLKDKDELIKWPALFSQFSDFPILRGDDLTNNKRKIREALLKIQAEYYPKAKFDFLYEGVKLGRSPKLIDPEDKRVGFTPATIKKETPGEYKRCHVCGEYLVYGLDNCIQCGTPKKTAQ